MKLLMLLLLPFTTFSQLQKGVIGVGMTGGYMHASKNAAVAEVFISYGITENISFYPISFKINSRITERTMPPIIEPRISFRLGFLEVYGGYGWHGYNPDKVKEFEPYVGFKPGIGIILHHKKMILTTALSGLDNNKIFTLQAGFFIQHKNR